MSAPRWSIVLELLSFFLVTVGLYGAKRLEALHKQLLAFREWLQSDDAETVRWLVTGTIVVVAAFFLFVGIVVLKDEIRRGQNYHLTTNCGRGAQPSGCEIAVCRRIHLASRCFASMLSAIQSECVGDYEKSGSD